MKAIFSFLFFAFSLSAIAQDTLKNFVYFSYNSSTVSAQQVKELDAIEGIIISIDAYASIEGDSMRNVYLSCDRGHSVSSLVDFKHNCKGGTTQFGSYRSANRCVVVTYVTTALPAFSNVPFVADTNVATDLEGFTCGERRDYNWDDTLNTETALVVLPEPIEVTAIVAEVPVLPSVVTVPALDSFYLPTQNAIRFYMKRGSTRAEATSIVTGRKDQWRDLRKSDIKRPKKAKKCRKPKPTQGLNDSFWSHLLPMRGC